MIYPGNAALFIAIGKLPIAIFNHFRHDEETLTPAGIPIQAGSLSPLSFLFLAWLLNGLLNTYNF